jgi:hypothetical protein
LTMARTYPRSRFAVNLTHSPLCLRPVVRTTTLRQRRQPRCVGCRQTSSVATQLGPIRPDRLTIWPVEGELFGIDVRWAGSAGNRRATVVARLLSDAGIRGRLTQTIDGAWEVRVGPVPGGDVARVIDEFVW